MGSRKRDQLPGTGCGNCGAYDGETQHALRKHLEWDGQTWLCSKCAAEVVAGTK